MIDAAEPDDTTDNPPDDAVGARLIALRQRIDGIERDFDHPIEVIPVTKGFDHRAVEAAARAGCRVIGENYAQDLLSKAETIARLGLGVQFIGRLQSNKVRQLVGIVTLWATIDRGALIDEVAKRAPHARILVQVNATGEADKGGCRPDEVAGVVARARLAGLEVDGLMTVGPTGEPPAAARVPFTTVRHLVDELQLRICSMGMSDDLDVAVECGSTQLRIGSALFGPRPARY